MENRRPCAAASGGFALLMMQKATDIQIDAINVYAVLQMKVLHGKKIFMGIWKNKGRCSPSLDLLNNLGAIRQNTGPGWMNFQKCFTFEKQMHRAPVLIRTVGSETERGDISLPQCLSPSPPEVILQSSSFSFEANILYLIKIWSLCKSVCLSQDMEC